MVTRSVSQIRFVSYTLKKKKQQQKKLCRNEAILKTKSHRDQMK